MKKNFWTVIFLILVVSQLTTAQEIKQPTTGLPVEKLGAFVGKWNGKGELVNSAYSKAQTVSAETDCNWSANHGFLICDQTVHLTDGNQNDLSVYTYNEKDHSYAFFGHSRNDSQVRTPKLTIEGNFWTYFTEFDDGPKHIRIRTINEFKTPSLVTYRTEFSEDGTNWKPMGSGSMTREK